MNPVNNYNNIFQNADDFEIDDLEDLGIDLGTFGKSKTDFEIDDSEDLEIDLKTLGRSEKEIDSERDVQLDQEMIIFPSLFLQNNSSILNITFLTKNLSVPNVIIPKIPIEYINILLKYMPNEIVIDFNLNKLNDALIKLNHQRFESLLSDLNQVKVNIEKAPEFFEIFFLHGLFLIQSTNFAYFSNVKNLLENLKKIDSKKIVISDISFSRIDFVIYFKDQFDKNNVDNNFLEEHLNDLKKFASFPELLRQINSCLRGEALDDPSRDFSWNDPVLNFNFWEDSQAIHLLSILVKHQFYKIFKQLFHPHYYKHNKLNLISILSFCSKITDLSDDVNNNIIACFPEVMEIDRNNKKLICGEPTTLLPQLLDTLGFNCITFKPHFKETQKIEKNSIQSNQKKRSREIDIESLSFQKRVKLNGDGNVEETKKEGIVASPSQQQNPSNEWVQFFNEVAKSNINILDLSELKDFNLNNLLPLKNIKKATNLHLNACILENNVDANFTFKNSFLEIKWTIEKDLDLPLLELIRMSSSNQLKLAFSLSEETVERVLSKINPQEITLFDSQSKPFQNWISNIFNDCDRLKKICWESTIKNRKERALFSDLINKKISICYLSKEPLIFKPREDINKNTCIEEDIFNCLKILNYLFNDKTIPPDYWLLNPPKLVLIDSDVHLIPYFPLVSLFLLNESTFELTKFENSYVLKALEFELVRIKDSNMAPSNNLSAISCSPKRFWQIFNEETITLFPNLAQILWSSASNSVNDKENAFKLLKAFSPIIFSKKIIETSKKSHFYTSYINLIRMCVDEERFRSDLKPLLSKLYEDILTDTFLLEKLNPNVREYLLNMNKKGP